MDVYTPSSGVSTPVHRIINHLKRGRHYNQQNVQLSSASRLSSAVSIGRLDVVFLIQGTGIE